MILSLSSLQSFHSSLYQFVLTRMELLESEMHNSSATKVEAAR